MLSDSDVSEDYQNDEYFQQIQGDIAMADNEDLEAELEGLGEPEDEELKQKQTELQAKLELKQQIKKNLERKLQESTIFEANLADSSSFASFFNYEDQIDNPLEREIATYAQNCRALGNNIYGYHDYFNYSLDVNTWRRFVNKQIYMKFERLWIEKQMNEVNQKKKVYEQ